MKKSIYLIIVFVFCSFASAFGQSEDYARLASDSFSKGAYSQALVYCSMYAAENAERLPVEKNVKLCLEYERQFDEAVMNKNVSLAKVFCDKITALNPNDKKIRSRLSALETQIQQSRTVTVPSTLKPRRTSVFKQIPNYFNLEATIVKDLEISFNMNYSCFLFGINYGYDMWKSERFLTEPAPLYASEYSPWSHTEIVHPMHLMLHAGLFFKYIAFDCGVGYVFAKTRTATYNRKGYALECDYHHEHSDEKNEMFFTFRPEVKVFIPFGEYSKDYHWIFTFGYNFVKDANCTEGITISTGWGWQF